MKILLLASAFSGLTQRVQRELFLSGHTVEEHCEPDERVLMEQLARFAPDLIICPFLTWRIPEQVWRSYPCLVVHPGIEGDRGPSSLDWAILQQDSEWGVTLLEAAAEMDAGDIWGTRVFPMRSGSKLSIYKREVSSAAVELIKQAVIDAERADFQPRPLNYDNPAVKGCLLPMMRQDNRSIDWQNDSTEQILAKLNAADTSPGVADSALDATGDRIAIHLYGAVIEPALRGRPGDLLAIHSGAACYATRDGAVWIRQMKCKNHPALPPIKLPAAQVLRSLVDPATLASLPSLEDTRAIDDIQVRRAGDAAYLYFNFYNGAASTEQCLALRERLLELKSSDVKVIVFMGGEDFWGNGIHLNCIEAAADPAEESWRNINAIDDLIHEMIDCPRQVTVAALRNNAGAGGAIMALACDKVLVREGTVLNPHYGNMGLYGSEYWTYLLPKRVGQESASRIAELCEPMLAAEALQLGFADEQLPEDWGQYHRALEESVAQWCQSDMADSLLASKARERALDESQRPLADYRAHELAEMRKCFFNPDSEYHRARRAFVYKEKAPKDKVPTNKAGRNTIAAETTGKEKPYEDLGQSAAVMMGRRASA